MPLENQGHFVEEMIQKKKKYSETYIKNISKMLDKPELEVKRDIWEIISNTNIIF